MQNWWDILGVGQGADLRSVKRAYAAKLKAIHQGEDPNGFMELRAAYDAAQSEIKHREMYPDDGQVQSGNSSEVSKNESGNLKTEGTTLDHSQGQDRYLEAEWDEDFEGEQVAPTPQYVPVVEQLMQDVKTLVKSPWGVRSVDSWTALLDDSRLDDIDAFSDFENAMLNYLLNIHEFFDEEANIPSKLDPEIASLLFARFGWQEKRNSVHVNPVVFDWLSVKFFKSQEVVDIIQPLQTHVEPDRLNNDGSKLLYGIVIFMIVLIMLMAVIVAPNPS